jgi:p-methyltransferase
MPPDCIVIGVNEPPFEHYERLIRTYGEDSEAYRDLTFSFVELDGQKLTYVDLLNHAFQLAGRTPRREFRSCDIPNLAAVYLTNYLRKRGVSADFINLFQHEKDALATYLAQDPVCVAITTTFYVINFPAIEIVQFIREHNPRVPIVIGGPLIANYARRVDERQPATIGIAGRDPSRTTRAAPIELASPLADIGADIYVVEGQGELTLLRIVECLKSGRSLTDVPNILYTDDGVLVQTPREPEQNDLDACDIDWHGFGGRDLGRTIQTRTARSCAFSCAFCNYPGRAGKLTLSSVDTVMRELDSIRRLDEVCNVVFIDDTFNVPLARFKDLCRMLIRERYPFNWFSYFRCSNSDDEAFDLMAESGCKGVFLGIESGSPRILKNMSKAATVEKYTDGIRQLKQHGILTFASFIIGFPGETEETMGETADFIETTRPDYYRMQPWYCEPGTPIDRSRERYGIEGEGFVWRHATLDSLTAADHMERLFLSLRGSKWLPQWSFDFWIIPYLFGEGIDAARFAAYMNVANQLLALGIASGGSDETARRRTALVQRLTDWARELPAPHTDVPQEQVTV